MVLRQLKVLAVAQLCTSLRRPRCAASRPTPGSASPRAAEARSWASEKVSRRRLDEVCCELYPELSKAAISSWIAQGKVRVDNKVVSKAGSPVKATAEVVLIAKQEKFVCRAGYKLEAALNYFGIDVSGKRVLDAGISTGGFTDCLLQRGASCVVGVDVGYGQIADRIRRHDRVTALERTNVRHLKLQDLPCQQPVEMVTLDLSFISVLKVVPGLRQLMSGDAELVVLIKPQFEALRHQVEEGGVVRDPAVHEEVIGKLTNGIESLGLAFQGCMPSPLPGAVGGNQEFLAYFKCVQA